MSGTEDAAAVSAGAAAAAGGAPTESEVVPGVGHLDLLDNWAAAESRIVAFVRAAEAPYQEAAVAAAAEEEKRKAARRKEAVEQRRQQRRAALAVTNAQLEEVISGKRLI